MKIIEANNQLTIKQSKIVGLILGLVFLIAGTFALIYPDRFTDPLPLWMTIIFIVVGVVVIITTKNRTILIRKSENSLKIISKNLLGEKEEIVGLDEIDYIEMKENFETTYSNKGNSKMISYLLFIVKKSGEEIQLFEKTKVSGSKFFINLIKNKNKKIGELLAKHIGVNFEERRAPTVRETLGAIKEAFTEQIDKSKQNHS